MNGSNGVGMGARLRTNGAWIGILALTSGFQFFRGAPMDGMVFGVAGLLLVADVFGLLSFVPILSPRPRRDVTVVAGVVLTALLTLLPRYSVADGIILVAIGLTLVPFVWAEPPARMKHEADEPNGTRAPWRPALRRAALLWLCLVVVFCLRELGSFFLSMPSPTAEFDHPPLSDLVDPIMDNPIGKFAGIALWLMLGASLLRRGRVEK